MPNAQDSSEQSFLVPDSWDLGALCQDGTMDGLNVAVLLQLLTEAVLPTLSAHGPLLLASPGPHSMLCEMLFLASMSV